MDTSGRFYVPFRGLGQGLAITRHVDTPCGREGCGHGASGLNLWVRKNLITDEERVINLGGKNSQVWCSLRHYHPNAGLWWL